MLRRLRRIVTTLVVLIALAVLVPLAYIEGRCGPAPNATAAATTPAPVLPAIDEQGYRRKLDNTFFTFPEWYIVYSFEDFGRFLDKASESQFNYLGHITASGKVFAPSTGHCRRRRSPAPKSRR